MQPILGSRKHIYRKSTTFLCWFIITFCFSLVSTRWSCRVDCYKHADAAVCSLLILSFFYLAPVPHDPDLYTCRLAYVRLTCTAAK